MSAFEQGLGGRIERVARAMAIRFLPASNRARSLALLIGALCISHGVLAVSRDFTAARDKMVETIEMLAKAVPLSSGKQEINASILAAMRQVPRHELVPEDVRNEAYQDRPLPIGHGQMIS